MTPGHIIPFAAGAGGGGSPTADILVQRGTTDIGNTGGTDTSFTAVSSLTAAFAINSNNQRTHAGPASSNGNREGDDSGGTLELTGTGTLTFTRTSGSLSDNCRFAWEIWEYLGAVSGANEFIVRSRNTVTLTGATNSATLDNTPTEIDDCIPFVTGIETTSTTNAEDEITANAWIDDAGSLQVQRGGGTGGTVTVQVVTVEFTGSNWSVGHARSTGQSGDTGTLTLNTDSDGTGGSTFSVTAWDEAIIFGHTTDVGGGESLANNACVYDPGIGLNNVDWAFHSDHASTNDTHCVHVLNHADMVVTRFTDTASAEGASNVDVTSAGLTDLEQSSVVGFANTSGTGDALMRGWRNYRLTSLTNVEHWCHRSGNTMSHNIQVADLTGITS